MNLPIVLRDEAQAEFDEAFDWCDGKRPGLGPEFLAEVQKVFDRIAVNPLMHQVVFADTYHQLLELLLSKAVSRFQDLPWISGAERNGVVGQAGRKATLEPLINCCWGG